VQRQPVADVALTAQHPAPTREELAAPRELDPSPFGEVLRERARRRAIGEAQAEATNLASGDLDVAKFGTALARRGLRDEARPLLALRQQQKLLEKKILG
jgi:hypothetical protein